MLTVTRRAALAGAASVAILLAARMRPVMAQAAGPFTLPPLPYGFDANEPHIDAKTMEIHHDRHHAAYVANLNAAVKDHGQVAQMRLEHMLVKLGELPEDIRTAIRNSGGGHANHTMFWQIMGKGGGMFWQTGSQPDAALKAAIDRDFGGLDKLQEQFNAAGTRLFGSGWVFVTADGDGKLALVSKPNQDTPLMEGRRAIMGNDVWEHAYYLTYQNRRADYLKAWWNVVDWKKVSERYAAATSGTLGI